ncbi:VOC family protein [Emticicia sp. 21SJ11W-3]|uniref:VOC family protein n=1 Tax=Emticicia sp. 21SJ11W-3 TaxID=2916755 RepID=UPI00209DA628|nr:VOC family protein [Emticicia sp. 21SJ11W-3]UTA68286.1 VOC family protein [Emticicia sp. 21SJ11W-3]
MEKRVIGLGGVFFKSEDSTALRGWYKEHLGIDSEAWGGIFEWRRKDNPDDLTSTAWNPFKKDTTYFEPSKKDFMINYQVENLDELLVALKDESVTILGGPDDTEYGKFGWILDPEGNKIELWEPPKNV